MLDFLRKNKINHKMDLSDCLDLTDKANIEIEEKDDDMIHVTAWLWLWDQQYMTIIDRCGIAKRLGRSSSNIVCESDDIVNVYMDISEKELSVSAIVDTNELYEEFAVPLTKREIKSLKLCLNNALIEQFGHTLTETLNSKPQAERTNYDKV